MHDSSCCVQTSEICYIFFKVLEEITNSTSVLERLRIQATSGVM